MVALRDLVCFSQVNLIPVIGKADLLTSIELAAFKSRIKEEIECNGIQLYTFPNSIDPDESASETSQVKQTLLSLLCPVKLGATAASVLC